MKKKTAPHKFVARKYSPYKFWFIGNTCSKAEGGDSAAPVSSLQSGAASCARSVTVNELALASRISGHSCSSRQQPPPALIARYRACQSSRRLGPGDTRIVSQARILSVPTFRALLKSLKN